jgi:inhibitor of KinA sporulation pathway (predicted exonuclease)
VEEGRVSKSRNPHKLMDKVLVLDVESTCWKGQPPPGEVSEIIQIGVAFLDVLTARRDPNSRGSIMVRPARSSVSAFCTELTGLTQERVEEGMAFDRACVSLRETYLSAQRIWASYGDYDRKMFQRGCDSAPGRYPFGSRHLNVKTLFALITGLEREVGMSEALAIANLPLEGRHHDAGDDAWNIAGLLSWMMQKARLGVPVTGAV